MTNKTTDGELVVAGQNAMATMPQVMYDIDDLDIFSDMVINNAKSDVQVIQANEAFNTFVDYTRGCSMGSLALDFLLRGGLPNGRFHMIYGPSMAGKTTMSARLMAMAQSLGRPVLHIDAEYAADIHYFKVLGCDMNGRGYKYVQPTTGDGAFRLIKRVLEQWWANFGDENNGCKPGPVVIIDSLKALTPEAFMENDEKSPLALQARMFSQWMGPIKALIGKTNSILFGVNQVRQNPGQMFGNPETIPGGEALTFFADTILRLSRVGKVEETEWGDSMTMRINFKKAKHVNPGHVLDLQLIQGIGFDPTVDVWKFLELSGIGYGSRGWYEFTPYDDDRMPPMPKPLEYGKKYRWDDIVGYMVPMKGQHFSEAVLYKWCFQLMHSGVLFDMIRDYNLAQKESGEVQDISSGNLTYDFTALLNRADIQATSEGTIEDQKALAASTASGKRTRFRLDEYPDNELDQFKGENLLCDVYDNTEYPVQIVDFVRGSDETETKVKVLWTDESEPYEEEVALSYVIVDQNQK